MIIKPRTQILLLAAAFLAGFLIFGLPALSGRHSLLRFALPKGPQGEPTEGWTVCEDLYWGPIPGLPDWRRRFRLCHPDGYEYLAYCLQPELFPPPLGSECTTTGDGEFNCGQFVQSMRVYQVLQTPVPTSTPRPRPTRTPTTTPTATRTRRPQVFTPPARTFTPPPPTYITTTPFAARPHPGGTGNRGWLLALVFAAGGLIFVQAAGFYFFLRRK